MRAEPTALSDARTFCGAVPWTLISELSSGAEIASCFRVLEVRRQDARNGKPYLRLSLGDRSGTVTGMVWEE
ncbi:MAG TPA: hypothetical protein VFI96_01805, partial [Longimicrobiaceae bacterium]|nr:hypothetical protein [Longimicrobiaceae bacterium]